MYACLHSKNMADSAILNTIAQRFSPAVEQTADDTVVFSISPLRKLLGSPHQIASEICRVGYELHLEASLAITSNPDSAIMLARNSIGVILVTPGEERSKLAALPLAALPVEPDLLSILHGWGLNTCEDLAFLPEKGVTERLGRQGVHLHRLACGRVQRPLRISALETEYHERVVLDCPVDTLQPLLFLFARVLNDLCTRLVSQARAARVLQTVLELEGGTEFRRTLEFPVPLTDSASMLKLLQLDLECHGPAGAAIAFSLRIEPAVPRRIQAGFFLPPTPPPDKLQVTLARIAAMVGDDNVGTPKILNTHRPDAFQMANLNMASPPPNADLQVRDQLRLAMRLFRPALQAQVTLAGLTPVRIWSSRVTGKVLEFAGPWKTSGEWWTSTAWIREEWDVSLDDGGLYRIYLQPEQQEWYVAGMYD